MDSTGSSPRALIELPRTNAAETVETDLYVLPAGVRVGGDTVAVLATRSRAIWDLAATDGGRLLSVTAGGPHGVRSIALSWPLVTSRGIQVPPGTYQLVVPMLLDGRPVGFSVAIFRIAS